MNEESRLFDVRAYLPWLARSAFGLKMIDGLEHALGFKRVRAMVAELEARGGSGACAFETLLDLAGVRLDASGVSEAFPRSGGVVMVCNHPFGGTDSLAAPLLALRVRPDALAIANSETYAMRPMAPYLIPFEVMGREGDRRRNIGSMKLALSHLRSGGALVVFPAGAVERWRPELGRVAEAPWSPHIARLIARARVPVLPVRFFGGNPDWFHLLGALHPLVRTALIPRAFLAQRGEVVRCRAGRLLTPEEFPAQAGELSRLLQRRVDAIRECPGN